MKRLSRVALSFFAPSVALFGLGLTGCDVGEASDRGELVDADPLDTDGDGELDGIELDAGGPDGQDGQDGQDGTGTGGGQGGQGGEGSQGGQGGEGGEGGSSIP